MTPGYATTLMHDNGSERCASRSREYAYVQIESIKHDVAPLTPHNQCSGRASPIVAFK
jgi:hypothetical protein